MKEYLVVLFYLICFNLSAQMFDFLNYIDKNDTSKTDIGIEINNLHDEFGKKLKELIVYEYEKIQETDKILKFKLKDLPIEKANVQRYELFKILEDSLTLKEFELEMWYYNKIDILNQLTVKQGIPCNFKPMFKVRGRVTDMIIKMMIKDDDKIEKIFDGFSKASSGVLFAGEILAPNTFGLSLGVTMLAELTIVSVEKIGKTQIKKLLDRYSDYYTEGFTINPRKQYLEILEKKQNEIFLKSNNIKS